MFRNYILRDLDFSLFPMEYFNNAFPDYAEMTEHMYSYENRNYGYSHFKDILT